MLLTSSPALANVVSLPANLSSVQGAHGFSYESIGDSRSSNAQHPRSAVSPIDYQGEFSFGYPGDLPPPTFAHAELFPYVQHRPDIGGLTVQPGTSGFDFGGGTASIGVAIRWEAPAAGLYRIDGLIAPNNGVDVLAANCRARRLGLQPLSAWWPNSPYSVTPMDKGMTTAGSTEVPQNVVFFSQFSGVPYSRERHLG